MSDLLPHAFPSLALSCPAFPSHALSSSRPAESALRFLRNCMCLAQRPETDLRPVRPVGKTYYDILLFLLFKLFLACLTNGCVGMCVSVRDVGAGEIQRVLGVFWLPASISSDAAAHHDAFHRSSACVCRRFCWYLSPHTLVHRNSGTRGTCAQTQVVEEVLCIQGCYTKHICTRHFLCQIRCSQISP